MDADIFVPFVFFSFLAAIIIVPIMAKERTKRSAHDLISQALARGQQLEPELITKLSDNMLQEGNRARASLGKGVILLALGGGITGAAVASDGFHHGVDSGTFAPLIILGSVGLAFLALAMFDYATKKKTAE
ncbi:MAG TPA: DUF6249 domain-containing protein [Terricaulis sp.]|nr:DUF6249 domain-containing protein [Terricaulis sp.]